MADKIAKKRTPARSALAKLLLALLLMATALGCDSKKEAEQATPEKSIGNRVAVANTAKMSEIPEDQTLEGAGPNKVLFLVATPTPNPIPFQELVEFEVRVYEDAEHTTLAEGVSLDQVRPMMPAHNHGMKTKPEIEKIEEGVFKVSGLKFHMKGDGDDGYWTLSFTLRKGDVLEVVTFDIQCCRP